MLENYPTPTEARIHTAQAAVQKRIHDKAVEYVLSTHPELYEKMSKDLTNEMEYRLQTIRIFAESHAYKPFPKISCIKLVRQVYRLSLIEAKELVDYALTTMKEFESSRGFDIYTPNRG